MPTPDFASSLRIVSARHRAGALQNLFGDRAGVFRIRGDLAGAKRFPENDRAAHALAVLGCRCRRSASARFAISASTYDSVNFFEPMMIGSAKAD